MAAASGQGQRLRAPETTRAHPAPDLRGRVAVITGASAGVGRATARLFARHGASLALLARGSEGLEGAAREVEACGARALRIPTDVSDARSVETAADRIEEILGPIDVWVNNAMVTVMSWVWDMKPEEYRRVTEVTYLGVVHGTLAALRHMRPRDRGTIVQVGSALSYRAIPLQSAYCAAKHAVRGFTDSLRTELEHDGSHIHVSMVQLPALNTPQFGWSRSRFDRKPQPVPPIFQPEVAAEGILLAASSRRREVWVGGNTVAIIQANKLAPGVADTYLAKNGVGAQLTDQPVDPARPDNLFEPVAGDYGAHGSFDDRARGSSFQLTLSRHRDALLGGAALLGAALLAGWAASR